MVNREFVKDIVLEVESIGLYELKRLLDDKNDEITRELDVGIHRYISANVELVDNEPKLVLSVYKSEGGF